MRLKWRDGLATLFVAGAAVFYALWVTGTAMPGMSTRAAGWIVFGLGWAACTSNKNELTVMYGVGGRRAPLPYVVIASILGAVALVAGIIALVSANEAMLATLVAAMVALWAMSTVRHAIAGETRIHDQSTRDSMQRAA
jgi:hypothetical protein